MTPLGTFRLGRKLLLFTTCRSVLCTSSLDLLVIYLPFLLLFIFLLHFCYTALHTIKDTPTLLSLIINLVSNFFCLIFFCFLYRFLVSFLPETADHKLPDTLAEGTYFNNLPVLEFQTFYIENLRLLIFKM